MGKPTLGYATRTEAVLALRAEQLTTHQIAAKIGIASKTVLALEASSARIKSIMAKRPDELGRAVLVPLDVLNKMRRASAQRGMTPNELARRIVETVVGSGLIDAVLDDRGD